MAGKTNRAEEWLTEDGLLLLEGWARDGLTDKDIATKQIHCGERTFTSWKKKYDAIRAALKKGRAPVMEKVEKSLYDLCQVQKYTETIEEITEDANGRKRKHTRKITRETPPNPTAIIFALKNLKPHKWRDKQEVRTTYALENEVPKLYEALTKPALDEACETPADGSKTAEENKDGGDSK